MGLSKQVKEEITKKFGQNEKDTGRSEVQVALLSKRINDLTEHLKTNRNDHGCERGLKMMVGQRRRLLDYLKNTASAEKYKELITELGLRR